MTLKIFSLNSNAIMPQYSTRESACFDLHACLLQETVTGYDRHNKKFGTKVNGSIAIAPGERILVPTGLILSIPTGYSVRIHSRSGLSLKQGLILANQEGVIDSDYVDPLYLMMTNISTEILTINHGDRIAQGEITTYLACGFESLTEAPEQKTDRVGGLGSTGVGKRS